MRKKESSKKNVFGLVSKLGNLIKRRGYSSSNTENTDASSGENDLPKKIIIYIFLKMTKEMILI